jgi:Putative capsular polysaccharide synthesis protein
MNSGMLFGKLLLIYQMPKTGSQTIEATLQQCRLPHQIVRLHFLSSNFAEPIVEKLKSDQVPDEWKQKAREQLEFTRKMARIVRVRRALRACGFTIARLEIITGVREPISLGLSTMFENFSYFFPQPQPTLEDYIEVLQRPRLYHFSQCWFDWELKAFTGIDVFKTPFPQERGYMVYENRFARALVYRYEALDQLPTMLRQFLGCDIPTVLVRNLASSKPYAQAYRHAQEIVRLPPAFVGEQCNSKMMRHFYSQEERSRFFLRWTEGADVGVCAPSL